MPRNSDYGNCEVMPGDVFTSKNGTKFYVIHDIHKMMGGTDICQNRCAIAMGRDSSRNCYEDIERLGLYEEHLFCNNASRPDKIIFVKEPQT